uniref:Homing endonuclease LAGLIDADG domain-containing protein n=1 Tax=Wolfiporia cocos TaxID=81056 RepID=A0A7G7YDS1_9APHY|nr:hypothetical protein [Wolfiporia cocos]QNH92641.1 hypothetical protein [Wolfiporia cocos]
MTETAFLLIPIISPQPNSSTPAKNKESKPKKNKSNKKSQNKSKSKSTVKLTKKEFGILLEKFVGIIDGDGYFDIGPQKQYCKNPNRVPKATIRIRLGINLQAKDKPLLDYLSAALNIGNVDYQKTKDQYRLLIYKTETIQVVHSFLVKNQIEFLTYERRKQYFRFKYIIENHIRHWENFNQEEVDKLFEKTNKQYHFTELVKLPYYNNWLVGFTIAEGSFHIKEKGTVHFSIVQSGHEDYHIIKAIHYFIKGPDSFDHIINPEEIMVYRISFSAKEDLKIIIGFYNHNKLLGLKLIQYTKWLAYINKHNTLEFKKRIKNNSKKAILP